MARTDGEVNIGTKIDNTGINKGLTETENKVTKFAKDLQSKLKNSTAPFTEMASAVGLLKTTIGTAANVVKGYTAAIKETADAYNKQLKAEKQLEAAAANNPYLNNKSVTQLKSYASNLQEVTSIGDESLLPLMAQLAGAGRTQAEIQDIMKAALDLSASGTMSLDAAVQALNKTYSGNIGLLGNQIQSLKGLTSEDLKNGKAVEIVKKQYEGLAEATASASSSYEKMKNAAGDFKEEVGKLTKPSVDSWNNFWKGFYESGIKIIQKLNNALENWSNNKRSKTYVQMIDSNLQQNPDRYYDAGERYIEIAAELRQIDIEDKENLITYLEGKKELSEVEAQILELSKKQVEGNRASVEYAQQLKLEREAAEEAAEKEAAEKQAINEKAEEALKTYNETIKKAEEEIKLRRSYGEEITEQEEKKLMLQAREQAYTNLILDSEGTITGNLQREKDELQKIVDLRKEITDEMKQQEGLEKIKDALGSSNNSTLSLAQELKQQLEEIDKVIEDAQKEGISIPDDLMQQYKDKRIELEKEITEAIKQENKDRAAVLFESIKNTISELASIQGQITDLATSNINSIQSADLASAQKDYEQGLISYEAYCDKINEINKESANRLYKVQMAEWAMSLANATSNIAQGVTKAIAEGGVAGLISGALVSAAGSVQIAQLIANKPKAPSFATGGIVGGSSYYGDRVTANVNSGEMILNAQQQLALWKAANGGTAGGLKQDIIIYNSMADRANITTQYNEGQIRITITEVMKQEFNKGTFNKQIQNANAARKGVKIL